MEQKFQESAQRCKEKIILLEKKKRKLIHLPEATVTALRGGKFLRISQPQQTTIKTSPQQTLQTQKHNYKTNITTTNKPKPQQPNTIESHNQQTTTIATPQTHQNQPEQPQTEQHRILGRYPPGPKGHTVHKYDVDCLQEGRYITDAIINFSLAWVHGETLGEFKNQVRICDSYWYTRVTKGGHTKENVEENLTQTKKWYLGGHPLDKPITVIPICTEFHWLGVITIQREEEIVLC